MPSKRTMVHWTVAALCTTTAHAQSATPGLPQAATAQRAAAAAALLPSPIPALPLAQLATPRGQQTRDQLLAKARKAGRIRLIVTLRAPTQPEHMLNTPQVQAQRVNLASVQASLLNRISNAGAKQVARFDTVPVVVVESNAAALDRLLKSPEVESVKEDRFWTFNLAQSVPLIGADKAWAEGATGEGQVVAIVDTGVKSSHPFLKGKVVGEACFSMEKQEIVDESGTRWVVESSCSNGEPVQTGAGAGEPCTVFPDCVHGTHVAGIAAGTNASFSGVAKGAKVMAIKTAVVLKGYLPNGEALCPPPSDEWQAGCAVFPSESGVMMALEHVYSQRNNFRIAAVNLSLGGGAYAAHCDDEPIKPLIDNLRSAGIATVVAAGNGGDPNGIASPACVSSAVSVGGTNKADQVDVRYSNSAPILELLAPGTDINSSVFGLKFMGQGDYYPFSGTSMAAPHVTGAWAALKSKKPNASVTDVLEALKSTGKPIPDPRNGLAKPRIQVDAAFYKLAPPCFTASNYEHTRAGRATYSLPSGATYAKGSGDYLGLWNVFTTTSLKKTAADRYVLVRSCS